MNVAFWKSSKNTPKTFVVPGVALPLQLFGRVKTLTNRFAPLKTSPVMPDQMFHSKYAAVTMCSHKKVKYCVTPAGHKTVSKYLFLPLPPREMHLKFIPRNWGTLLKGWVCACWERRSRWEVEGLRGDELGVRSDLVSYVRAGSASWAGWQKNSQTQLLGVHTIRCS